MCSISGFIATKKYSRFAQEKFTNILLAGEVRGTDACGVAFNTGKNRFYYMKAPKPASEFIKTEVYKDLIETYNPTLLIGHNRAKTQGDEADNKNNHPIVTKTGLSLIHNGIISNDAEIAKQFNLTLDGKVDSEVIVRLIEYYKYVKGFDTIKAIRLTAGKLRGGLAFALLDAKKPNTVYLLASSNPLTLAYHKGTGTIFWASTDDILKRGLIEFDYYFKGFFKKARSKDDYVFEDLDDDTGIKMTARGWQMFSVKRPEYEYGGYDQRGYETGTYGSGHYNENKSVEIYLPSEKPVIVEAKDEVEITKLLKRQLTDFMEYEPIKKPSEYLSELLLMRLEAIQDSILMEKEPEAYGAESLTDLQNEVRRIINTLKQRQKKTKREICIPTLDEVIRFGDAEKGFGKVGWILAEKNKELFDLIENAKEEDEEDKKLAEYAERKEQEQKQLPLGGN